MAGIHQIEHNEVAEILLRALNKHFPDLSILPDESSSQVLVDYLKESIDPELIHECMTSELGQGILLGIVSVLQGMDQVSDEDSETEQDWYS